MTSKIFNFFRLILEHFPTNFPHARWLFGMDNGGMHGHHLDFLHATNEIIFLQQFLGCPSHLHTFLHNDVLPPLEVSPQIFLFIDKLRVNSICIFYFSLEFLFIPKRHNKIPRKCGWISALMRCQLDRARRR